LPLRAVAHVNLAAIERNVTLLRERVNRHRHGHHVRVCAVVKADGYGHGAAQAARAALEGGASMLAVATAREALELKQAGLDTPTLILGAVSAQELPVALESGAELTVWDEGFVRELIDASANPNDAGGASPLRLHVKLDTGLGRLGTRSADEALAVVRAVVDAAPALELAGVMTHLATADDDHEFARDQLAQFGPFVAEARAIATTEIIAHAANSAATLLLPDSHFDMVRVGIAIYGADPMNQDPTSYGLEPVLSLRSYVAAVKPIAPGQSLGYGRHFIATEASVIATLPLGYGDGLPRALANNCDVLIEGHRYPLRGMVSMDNITVDVGPDSIVKPGDKAMLIGTDGEETQLVEDLARRIGTIDYEILCGIPRRVPRVYHRDGVRGE
jgi:alanine racemase